MPPSPSWPWFFSRREFYRGPRNAAVLEFLRTTSSSKRPSAAARREKPRAASWRVIELSPVAGQCRPRRERLYPLANFGLAPPSKLFEHRLLDCLPGRPISSAPNVTNRRSWMRSCWGTSARASARRATRQLPTRRDLLPTSFAVLVDPLARGRRLRAPPDARGVCFETRLSKHHRVCVESSTTRSSDVLATGLPLGLPRP